MNADPLINPPDSPPFWPGEESDTRWPGDGFTHEAPFFPPGESLPPGDGPWTGGDSGGARGEIRWPDD